MTSLAEFSQFLTDHHAELDAWGMFVRTTIKSRVDSGKVSIQIEASRTKDVHSAIGKIARKNYTAPLIQMTDLVGVRFVVLISPQIDEIAGIIESSSDLWHWELARDPEEEAAAAPENFSYKSKHYVVRSAKQLDYKGQVINAGLPCEIQIRTIMQHAYAEITHDSIYKPSAGRVPPKALRFIASSMALIETTDHLFCETMRLLEEENRPRNQLWAGLKDLYNSLVGDAGLGYDDKLNLAVLDALDDYRSESTLNEIRYMFDNRQALVKKILLRIPNDPFWSQPTSMLAYWLVGKDDSNAIERWPFASAREALALVYSDLGIAPPLH
ncbi:GTP pyrophosphokinase [Herbaspirillum seropedicae]|uniref:GTP pyrophosphokinase n=1 Tax=Herbaspirillum seropedicae TaxID=964 RepID=UPI003F8CF5CD